MEKKEIIIAIMAAIIFTDIRKMRTTQHEAVDDSADVAVSLYTKVCENLR
jgi:hypothetical protein